MQSKFKMPKITTCNIWKKLAAIKEIYCIEFLKK